MFACQADEAAHVALSRFYLTKEVVKAQPPAQIHERILRSVSLLKQINTSNIQTKYMLFGCIPYSLVRRFFLLVVA